MRTVVSINFFSAIITSCEYLSRGEDTMLSKSWCYGVARHSSSLYQKPPTVRIDWMVLRVGSSTYSTPHRTFIVRDSMNPLHPIHLNNCNSNKER